MNSEDRELFEKYVKFYNPNPKLRNTDDGVVRALSAAFGQSWEETYRELFEESLSTGYSINDNHLLSPFISSRGWKKHFSLKKPSGEYYTVKEVIDGQLIKVPAIIVVDARYLVYFDGLQLWDMFPCYTGKCRMYWLKV